MIEDGKKRVIFYRNWGMAFLALKPEDAGILIQHFCQYINKQHPPEEALPQQVLNSWLFIKPQLKEDYKKWEQKKDLASEKGKLGNLKRWHPEIYQQVIDKKISLKNALELATQPDSKISGGDRVAIANRRSNGNGNGNSKANALTRAHAREEDGDIEKENQKIVSLYNTFFRSMEKGEFEISDERLAMEFKVDPKDLIKTLPKFKGNLIDSGISYSTVREMRKHWVTWLRRIDKDGKLDQLRKFKDRKSK